MTQDPETPRPDLVHGTATAEPPVDPEKEKKKKKKKEKVRSAWISFIGRIVAQVVGAVATIVLGLMFMQKYSGSTTPSGSGGTQPALPPAATRTASTTGEKALVVLPLENFSADPKQEYFADGMTEALIADLAQVRGLRVISRTSAMQYKGKRKLLPDIARELNVDLIVEGSVFRESDRVRVTAQLIDARSDEHLWARSYDRTLRDVLALQSDIAQAISREINSALAIPARQAVSPSVDPAAYDAYLKGRQALSYRTTDGFQKSIEFFRQAIALHPRYAEAYAGIADAYALLGTLGYGNVPAREAMPLAKAAAQQALEINDHAAEAHAALGFVRHLYDWDWPAAEQSYRRALELQPGSSSTLQRYAMFLASQDRYPEGLPPAQRAVELDPLSANAYRTLGLVHYLGRQFQPAIGAERRSLELDPSSVAGKMMLSWSLIGDGKPLEAVTIAETALQAGSRDAFLGIQGQAYGRAGEREKALAIRGELLSRQPPSTGALVRVNAGLCEADAAFRALDQAVAERLDLIMWLKVDPMFDCLRSDARFAALLQRVRLGDQRSGTAGAI